MTWVMCFLSSSTGSLRPDAEHQLFPLTGSLHGLGGELGHIGNERHLCRNDILRHGVQHQPHLGAKCDPPRRGRWQEKSHVDIAQVNQAQHPAAGSDHLAGLGHPILHPAIAWGFQGAVQNVCLDPFGVGPGRLDRRIQPRQSGCART